MRRHLAWTWRLPSWHGGDIVVPGCHKAAIFGRDLVGPLFRPPQRDEAAAFATTADPAEVDCPACRALIAEGTAP